MGMLSVYEKLKTHSDLNFQFKRERKRCLIDPEDTGQTFLSDPQDQHMLIYLRRQVWMKFTIGYWTKNNDIAHKGENI